MGYRMTNVANSIGSGCGNPFCHDPRMHMAISMLSTLGNVLPLCLVVIGPTMILLMVPSEQSDREAAVHRWRGGGLGVFSNLLVRLRRK